MLTGYAWSCAHRPDATFDYAAEVGGIAWVEANSAPLYAPEWAARLQARPLLLVLGVSLDALSPGAWRAYCEGLLSWFCWASMPGVVGARDDAAIRDALVGNAQ